MDADDRPDSAWNDQPPEPPTLAIEHVEALIGLMHATIEWVRHDEAETWPQALGSVSGI